MSNDSKRLSNLLQVMGIALLVVGLIPGRSKYTDDETKGRVTEWRIGLPFSPVWEYRRLETESGFTFNAGVRIASWSWLPLLTGIACLKFRLHAENQNAPRTLDKEV